MTREMLEQMWQPEYLERLAHAYWRYLTRVSLGLIRIFYAPGSRTVGLLSRRIPLLRFRRPEYIAAGEMARVTWRIERGMLVVPRARPGLLANRRAPARIRAAPRRGNERVLVRTEVSNFYPFIRGGGWFARIGVWVYNFTQLRIHVWITHGFLRSLARVDLPPSPVGALVGLERIADADGDGIVDRPAPDRARPAPTSRPRRSRRRPGASPVERCALDLEQLHAARVGDDRLGSQALDQGAGDVGVDRSDEADPVRRERRAEAGDADPGPRPAAGGAGDRVHHPAVGGDVGAADLDLAARAASTPGIAARKRRTSAIAIGCVLVVVQRGVTIIGRRCTR